MPKTLPTQPNVEHLKGEAKALLRQHQRGDPEVCGVLRLHHRFRDATPEQILSDPLTLQEAQHALALSYGFSGWSELKAQVRKEAEVAEKVRECVEIFTSKGPAHNSTRSEWDLRRCSRIGELGNATSEDFRILEELAKSSKCRGEAAYALGRSKEPRALELLMELLRDPAAGVRKCAVRATAARIHPDAWPDPGWGWGLAVKAERLPDSVEPLLELMARMTDENSRVRTEAVCAIAAYAHLGDSRIDEALERALHDESHSVQHAAARAMTVRCPGCGSSPER